MGLRIPGGVLGSCPQRLRPVRWHPDKTQIGTGGRQGSPGTAGVGDPCGMLSHETTDHPQDAPQGLGAGRPSTLVGQRGLWAAGGLRSCRVFTEEVVLERNILLGFDCTESNIKTIQHHLIFVDYEHVGVC